MPIHNCPQCGHVFPSPDAIAPTDVADRCTECTRNDPLSFLDNLASEFQGSRVVTSELFDDQGALFPLYHQVESTDLHRNALLRWDFERAPDKTRQGKVLAYLAQSIRNDGVKLARDMLGREPNVVVAATLIMVNGAPRFVVGVNGHEKERPAIDFIVAAIPDRIAGVEVETVTELEPHEGAVAKRLEHLEVVTGWNWHAEQKVLRYIKTTYGTMPRLTATSMGIAHVAGPCTPESAGHGTHYCFHYLRQKFDKDDGQLRIGGNATHGVAAYWYAGKQSSQAATLTTLK